MSRIIAIGDIHGCDAALEALIDAIKPRKRDMLIPLGDFIDRGPQSAAVVERLINLMSKCKLIPLIGNHEIMMFSAFHSAHEHKFWLNHGGAATLASYGGSLQNVPQHHLSFLGHCLRFAETEHHFFVHARYLPHLPLPHQPDECIFWQHIYDDIPAKHQSNKIAIVGHTPQMSGEIRNLGHIWMIDTNCYGGQWLSAIDVESRIVWQSDERGRVREIGLPAMEKFGR